MPRDGLTTSMITLLFCKDTSSKTNKKKPKCWQRTRVSFPFSQVKQHFIGRIKVDFERGSLPFSCPVLVSIHNSVCRHGVCVRTCKEQRESFPRLLFSFSRLLQKGNESPYIAMSIDLFRTTWRLGASSSVAARNIRHAVRQNMWSLYFGVDHWCNNLCTHGAMAYYLSWAQSFHGSRLWRKMYAHTLARYTITK